MNVELGKAWLAGKAMDFEVSRYPAGKKLWIKYKKIMNRFADSNFKLDDVMEIIVKGIF